MVGKGKGKGKGKKKARMTKEERLDQALLVSENTNLKTKVKTENEEKEILKVTTTELKQNLEKQQGDQADIVEFLKGQIREKEADLRRADEKNLDLTDQLEVQKAEGEKRLQQSKDEAKEVQVGLQDELQKAQDELEKLLAFRAIKDELEKEVEELRDVLQKEKKRHQEEVASIERKSVKEKEGLKKEMVAKIRDIESRFLKMTDNQLEVITKRTILENEGMRTELKYQSRRTENLIVDNDRLSVENAKLKHETEMQVSLQQQLAKKNRTLSRQLQSLTQKVQSLEVAAQSTQAEKQIAESAEMQMLREALSRQAAECEEAENTLEDAEEEIRELRDQNEEIRAEYQRIMDLQNETAVFIMSAMEELKQDHADTISKLEDEEAGVSAPPAMAHLSWDSMNAQERHSALQFLLARVSAYGRESALNHPPQRGPSQAASDGLSMRSGSRGEVRLPPMPSSAGTNGRMSAGFRNQSRSQMSTPASEFDFSAASVSNYMNFFGAPFPHTPKSRAGRGPPPDARDVGTQTVSSSRKYLSDHFAKGEDPLSGVSSGRQSSASGVLPDRPWGRRAQVLPLTISRPDTFMRRGGRR